MTSFDLIDRCSCNAVIKECIAWMPTLLYVLIWHVDDVHVFMSRGAKSMIEVILAV
jgi:hypothetical protein